MRWKAVNKGAWRATAPFRGKRGFHINALCSPWLRLEELVSDFLAAQNDNARLQVFINTALAETWRDTGEVPDWQRLYDRREDWPTTRVPAEVLFLTAGVDVQKDRLEARVWGWGRDRQSWHIETRVVLGDPSRLDVWYAIDELVGDVWQHEGGAEMRLVRLGVDSGYATTDVYNWAKRHDLQTVLILNPEAKGSAAVGMPKVEEVNRSGKRIRHGPRVWPVNVGMIKGQLFGWLRLEKPVDGEPYPPGYVHLSKRCDADEVKQLVSEQLVTEVRKGGFPQRVWQRIAGRRNEGLDCRNYAHAAAIQFGLDRFTPRQWDQIARSLAVALSPPLQQAETPAIERGAEVSRVPPAQPRRRRIRWQMGTY